MKKAFAFLLAFLTMVFCAACGGAPANGQAGTPPPDTAPADDRGTLYAIADYYDANGGFSALGLALDEENSEKVLTVKAGDILIVGNREYSVTAESLTLTFYTQPSLDEVIVWWMDYCEQMNGIMRSSL